MKKLKLIALIICIILPILAANAATVNVEGFVKLENKTKFDSVYLILKRITPSVLYDTIITNDTGYYKKQVQTGLYTIMFVKKGYITDSIYHQTLFSNTILPTKTLLQSGLSGVLSGTIEKGTYRVTGDVIIPTGKTLTIKPGVTLLFSSNIQFTVNGKLIANGTANDSIVFTHNKTGNTWGGIDFITTYDSENAISYSKIEYSSSSGIFISAGQLSLLSHVIIRNCKNQDAVGGGIFIDNYFGSNFSMDHIIFENKW